MLFIFLQKRLRYQFLVTEALGKNTLVDRRHSASLPRSRFLDVTQRSPKAGSCPRSEAKLFRVYQQFRGAPREQNFHPTKCSTIFKRLNIWQQAPGAN